MHISVFTWQMELGYMSVLGCHRRQQKSHLSLMFLLSRGRVVIYDMKLAG